MLTHRPPHTHSARILRFADADTVVLLIEGLFGTWTTHYVRLEGIESFELDGPDAAKAKAFRQELNRLLQGRDVLVHLTSHGHDKYARLRGRVTVGDSDLAEEIVKRGFAWHCTAKQSAALHAATRTAAPLAAVVITGCNIAKDAGTLIVMNGARSGTGTNGLGRADQHIDAAVKATNTTPTHAVLWVLGGVALIALVAGIIWLVHNRGKLAGLAASLATKA